jgi:hypothetical protein
MLEKLALTVLFGLLKGVAALCVLVLPFVPDITKSKMGKSLMAAGGLLLLCSLKIEYVDSLEAREKLQQPYTENHV